ncbi:hypothetical protein ACS0TY_015703 [Phlomoides rotata]
MKSITRLCQSKNIVTVNGQFPGPTLTAREGDRVIVKVVNHVKYNVSIHWHGVRQLRSAWADGPAYAKEELYFGMLIFLGLELHSMDLSSSSLDEEARIRSHIRSRKSPSFLDNGGRVMSRVLLTMRCNRVELRIFLMLSPSTACPVPCINARPKRLINAALNDELFFSIVNHNLTVVEVDAVYVKPFKTNIVLISPGQTTNVLLRTKRRHLSATFLMSAQPYATGPAAFDNSITAGILEYHLPPNATNKIAKLPLLKPSLPAFNNTKFATKFTEKIRSLANSKFSAKVPLGVDRQFFFTVGLGLSPCSNPNNTCQGPNNTMLAASVNNVSFVMPNTALLQAHFFNRLRGVYTADFPANPPVKFNYTGNPPNNTMANSGTKVVVLPFNTTVEVVMQDTSIIGAESHPMHLHGFNFFVMGQGFGNFDPKKDPAKFNLVDPAERNTVGVPAGGWVAIRFLADNPGVWFMHCHLEVHTSWGLKMAWVVMDGSRRNQKPPPPPTDLPKC